MTVPTYDQCMIPLLQFASDGNDHHIREAIDALAIDFNLTETDRAEMLPSGKKFTFDDRVQWANTYLKKAALFESVARGIFRITSRGREVLEDNLTGIDASYLMQFPEFVAFKRRTRPDASQEDLTVTEQETRRTPQEILQSSYETLKDELAQDLLDAILSCPFNFFERLVLDLLLALGYGSAIQDAGQVIGRSGDNGIDGIIKEDKLGFDAIYIQAKRWGKSNNVSRPAIQAYAGSLLGQGASKGVFITTSSFSKEAMAYANKITQPKIILIDGQQLAKLMIDNNIGVMPIETYTVKRVDFDYFPVE